MAQLEEGDVDAAWLARLCRWLGRCTRLAHLGLSVSRGAPAEQLLSAVGAAAGGRLRSLTLDNAVLPPTRGAAAAALLLLPDCYPLLEVLELKLCLDPGMEAVEAEALSRELLLSVPGLAPRCPALREVWVDPTASRHAATRGIQKAVWLRPGA